MNERAEEISRRLDMLEALWKVQCTLWNVPVRQWDAYDKLSDTLFDAWQQMVAIANGEPK